MSWLWLRNQETCLRTPRDLPELACEDTAGPEFIVEGQPQALPEDLPWPEPVW